MIQDMNRDMTRDLRLAVGLIVDDNPDTVRMLTEALEATGMDVMVALDGAAALAAAARMPPDIVLMDALMPIMDGFETCRRLKALSGFDAVPVIFMTALSDPDDILRAFGAGGADYVTKPIAVDAMLARINVHLANARKIRSARLALDAADQFLVATEGSGRITWFTPQALRLLEERFIDPAGGLQLRPEIVDWLVAQADGGAASPTREIAHEGSGLRSRISFLRRTDQGEILFRVADRSPQQEVAALSKAYKLTVREAEVASWIAKGKSNRDIAAILSLSPRTIDKHLEVIFSKLNVENRTAAAALIIAYLPT